MCATTVADGRFPAIPLGRNGRPPIETEGFSVTFRDRARVRLTKCSARTRAPTSSPTRTAITNPRTMRAFRIAPFFLVAAGFKRPRPASTLHAGERDPFDEGPLGQEEQHDDGQHEQDRRR